MDMQDDRRRQLEQRLTPAHLYKLTPRTNCGACGFPTCLAYATQVIVGQGLIHSCPHIEPTALDAFEKRLAVQHRSGIGLRREGFEKTLQFLRGEIAKWDLRTIAESLGAEFSIEGGDPQLRMVYFGGPVRITTRDIVSEGGQDIDPWEKIFLYNYVIGGAVEPSGEWVGMESLPNSVSKIKSLKTRCEDRLAQAFSGKTDQLSRSVPGWSRTLSLDHEKVDFAGEFQILPRLSVRVLWWDEDPGEGFGARTKFLFDSRVLQVVDLESLLFACEKLTDQLLHLERPVNCHCH